MHDISYLALLTAFINNFLLQEWNIFRRAFDTQISTRHHDSVASSHNLLEIVIQKARGLFNLGHDSGSESSGGQFFVNQGIDFINIRGSLDERKRNPVDTNSQHVLQVTAVLGCEGTNLENRVGSVDSLAVLDFSRNIDIALEVVGALGNDAKFDLAVVNEQKVTDFGGLDDLWVGQLTAVLVALGFVRIETEQLILIEVFSIGVGEFTDLS